MINEHKINALVYKASHEELLSFFNDCIVAITKLDSLYKELKSMYDENGVFIADEDDQDDLFDSLDSLNLKISDIYTVGTMYTSTVDVYNKYISRTVLTLKMLVENVQSITNKGLLPADGDVQILMDEIFSVIGGLSYYVVNEFAVDKTTATLMENLNADYDIDSVYDAYAKRNGFDTQALYDFGTQLVKYMTEYKYRFDLFDEYPELEGDFEKVVGPLYNIIPEEVLDYDTVVKIINGEIQPETLVNSNEVECEVE